MNCTSRGQMFNNYSGTVQRINSFMFIHLCRDMSDVQMFKKSMRVSPEVGRAGEAELWIQNTPQVEQKFKNCVSSERSSCTETETHNTQQQVCRSSSIFLMTLMKLAQMVLVVMLPGCLDSHRMRVRSSRSSTSSVFTTKVKPKTIDRFSGEYCHFYTHGVAQRLSLNATRKRQQAERKVPYWWWWRWRWAPGSWTRPAQGSRWSQDAAVAGRSCWCIGVGTTLSGQRKRLD